MVPRACVMALPTERELRRIAADTGYRPATLETVTRLLDLLMAIMNDPALGPNVALYGGTALNGFYSDWPRLSLDIDLTYMGPAPESALDEIRSRGDDALHKLLVARGYGIKEDPANSRAGGKWKTRFASHFSGDPQLDVDLAYVDRRPLFDPVIRSSAEIGGRTADVIRVLDEREVIALKLCAVFGRVSGRDIFDVLRILERADDLDWRHIKAAFLVRQAPRRADPRDITVDWIGPNPKKVRGNLERCMRVGFFKENPVNEWILESVEICRDGLRSRIKWTGNDIAFVEGIRDLGEINPHLIDADPEFQDRIHDQPRIQQHVEWVREKMGRGPQTFSIPARRPDRSLSL